MTESLHALTAAEVGLPLQSMSDSTPTQIGQRLRGRFAVIHINLTLGKATLVTDRFAVLPLCYSIKRSTIAFSDRADGVLYQTINARSTRRRSSTMFTFI